MAQQLRKYEVIWEQLKQAGSEKWIVINLADAGMMQTIINMVQVEKSRANVARKNLDLPQFGRLVIKRDPLNKKVSFMLKNSGDAL